MHRLCTLCIKDVWCCLHTSFVSSISPAQTTGLYLFFHYRRSDRESWLFAFFQLFTQSHGYCSIYAQSKSRKWRCRHKIEQFNFSFQFLLMHENREKRKVKCRFGHCRLFKKHTSYNCLQRRILTSIGIWWAHLRFYK